MLHRLSRCNKLFSCSDMEENKTNYLLIVLGQNNTIFFFFFLYMYIIKVIFLCA